MIKRIPLLVAVLVGTLVLAGCFTSTSSTPAPAAKAAKTLDKPAAEGKDAKIKANLAKLDPEDRKLAEAQEWCAVQTKSPLGGSMGVPVKIMLKGQPVFLCCEHCKEDAEADQDKTLKTVEELKAKHTAAAK